MDKETTPNVQYTYDDGATGGVAKYVRLTKVIYPNGRDVEYGYGTTGAIDDIMSRLETISDGTGTLSSYKYLGANQIVEEDYVEASVKLTYLDSSGNVTGLDHLGRVADQLWERYGDDPAVLDEYTYTYDRAGNRTSRANATMTDGSLDESYSYDAADRLSAWSLGGTQQQSWSLDSLGNDLAAGTYNAANEETPTQGSSGYDRAGNMTTLQSGDTAIYDAWNRLTKVTAGSGETLTTVQQNEYDGTNRRIQIYSDFSGSTPGTVQDDYHVGQQVIESDVTTGGIRNGGYQYLWSPRYIDAPILRDTLNTAGNGIVTAQRVFYLADANYNVTGLVKYDSQSQQWQVAERCTYTPYGVVTYRNADWSTATSSANGNTTLYTGRTLDLLTSLYYYRARYYDAGLERFVNRDPISYRGGINLYEYVGDDPLTRTDPTGLEVKSCIGGCHGRPFPNPPPPPPGADQSCNNFPSKKCQPDPTKCTKEKCQETLQTIRDVAKQVPHYWPPDACQNWEQDFEQRLGMKLWGNPCIKDANVKGFKWFVPWAGHAAFQITLADGSVWYVDNAGPTSIGDCTHVGTDLPPWIW